MPQMETWGTGEKQKAVRDAGRRVQKIPQEEKEVVAALVSVQTRGQPSTEESDGWMDEWMDKNDWKKERRERGRERDAYVYING